MDSLDVHFKSSFYSVLMTTTDMTTTRQLLPVAKYLLSFAIP